MMDQQNLIVSSKIFRVHPPYQYLTLRPNGDAEKHLERHPSGADHYTAVDEEVTNDGVDFVGITSPDTYVYDTFDIQDHGTVTGIIDNITIYARGFIGGPTTGDGIPNAVKIIFQNRTIHYSSEMGFGQHWGNINYTYQKNPETSDSWTWSDIDNLKIGIAFIGTVFPSMDCTQIYCVVEYHEALVNQYTIALQNKADGHQVAKFCVGDFHAPSGIVNFESIGGLTVDRNGDIIDATGVGVFDTIKCRISGG
jgi:hypothetical protein